MRKIKIIAVAGLFFVTLFGVQNGSAFASKTKNVTLLSNGLRLKDGKYSYKVEKDDFLDFIATRFYGTKKAVPLILKWNKIKDPKKIFAGRILKFEVAPVNLDYKTSQRALFYALARKFKLSAKWAEESLAMSLKVKNSKTIAIPKKKQDDVRDGVQGMNLTLREGRVKSSLAPSANLSSALAASIPQQNLSPLNVFWKATLGALTARQLSVLGDHFYQQKKFVKAARFFRGARNQNPGLGKSWLLEMLSFKSCGWNQDYTAVRQELRQSRMAESVKGPLLAKSDEALLDQKKVCPNDDLVMDDLQPEDHLAAGEVIFAAGDKVTALLHLTEARKRDEKLVKAWILEIRCYRDLQKTKEAEATVDEFKQKHPNLSQLPFLRR